MIHDFRRAPPAQIDTDLCIVGGGMAGIALAHRLAGRRLDICVLESGDDAFDRDTQSLYAGDITGLPYFDPTTTRLRHFGGSSNHWTGQTGVLEPHDMAPRAWVPGPAWPISHAALAPWYAPAARLLRFQGEGYAPAPLFRSIGLPASPFAGDALQVHIWRHSDPPIRFAAAYGPHLAAAPNIRVMLGANVADIATTENASHVTGLEIRSLAGHRAIVRARAYVLACGGIENPRLLLNATTTQKMGLGNAHDQVGRHFMEHPNVPVGRLAPADLAGLYPYVVRSPRVHQQTDWRGAVSLSPAVRTREQALGATLKLDLPRVGVLGGTGPGHAATHPGAFAANLWRRYVDGLVPTPRALPMLDLVMELEQAPDPDSRITLTAERDAIGLRQPALHWRLGALEKRTARLLAAEVARAFGRQGWGRLQPAPWLATPDDTPLNDTWPDDLEGAHHHMGTTRMSDDPRHGVVNPDGRLHGTDNLYIAGCSVFPTGGYVNPSLTILALTLRLAEHLADVLEKT